MGSIRAMINFRFISKRMAILSLVYFMFIVIMSTKTRGISNSLFDFVANIRWGGSASVLTLTLGVLPLLALVLPLLMDRLESDMIVIRIKQKRRLFYGHFSLSIFISAFFTFLMAISGIVGSLIATGHVDNLWGTKEGTIYFLLENKSYFQLYPPHVTSGKIWTYLLSSRFLAILFMATFVIFLKAFLRKNIYVFFISLIILGSDGLFTDRFSLFLGRVGITLDTWISPGDQLFNLIYLALWIIVMSFLCIKLYDKKEFYH